MLISTLLLFVFQTDRLLIATQSKKTLLFFVLNFHNVWLKGNGTQPIDNVIINRNLILISLFV